MMGSLAAGGHLEVQREAWLKHGGAPDRLHWLDLRPQAVASAPPQGAAGSNDVAAGPTQPARNRAAAMVAATAAARTTRPAWWTRARPIREPGTGGRCIGSRAYPEPPASAANRTGRAPVHRTTVPVRCTDALDLRPDPDGTRLPLPGPGGAAYGQLASRRRDNRDQPGASATDRDGRRTVVEDAGHGVAGWVSPHPATSRVTTANRPRARTRRRRRTHRPAGSSRQARFIARSIAGRPARGAPRRVREPAAACSPAPRGELLSRPSQRPARRPRPGRHPGGPGRG
jgi:hypothetical protein